MTGSGRSPRSEKPSRLPDLVILGTQGSGKGTQAALIQSHFGYIPISAGELIRREIVRGTRLGRRLKQTYEAGKLIPHEVMAALMEKRLASLPKDVPVIFDAYPRTLKQLADFERIVRRRGPWLVISLTVPEQVALDRIVRRRICSRCDRIHYLERPGRARPCHHCGGRLIRRPDDTPGAIRRRLDTYQRETKPLLRNLSRRHRLIEIDGSGTIEQVFQNIRAEMARAGVMR